MDSWGSSQRWWSPQPPRALHIKFKSSQVKSSQVKSSQLSNTVLYCTVHTLLQSIWSLGFVSAFVSCLRQIPQATREKLLRATASIITVQPDRTRRSTAPAPAPAPHSTAQHSTAAPTTKHQAPANTSINPSSSQTRRRLVSSRCFALPSSTLPPSALLTPPFPRGPRCLGGRVEAQQASTAPCGRTRRRRPTRCPRCPRSPLGAPRRPPPPPTA
jgi:hypothetical protein